MGQPWWWPAMGCTLRRHEVRALLLPIAGCGVRRVHPASCPPHGLHAVCCTGGGGGLDNTGLSELLLAAGDAPCDKVAEVLASTAVSMGSTDDVTVVVIKLGRLD